MEQVFDSEECSSGCESGWTLYLQHSIHPSSSSLQNHRQISEDHFVCKKTSFSQEHDDDDGEEDMSMVSDASSGPPAHFQEHQEQEDEDWCDDNNNNNNNGVNGCCCCFCTLAPRKRRRRHLQDLPSSLDDTASSPFFSFSDLPVSTDLEVCNHEASMEDDDNFDYSNGHSTTYLEMV